MTDQRPAIPNPEPHQRYRTSTVMGGQTDVCVRCSAVIQGRAEHDAEHYWTDTVILRILHVLDSNADIVRSLTKMVADNAASTDDMIHRIINREAR